MVAADNAQDRESLRDLDGVRVAVEDLPLITPVRGLSKDQLRKTIETKLRYAGINVLNSGEFPVGDPFLSVQVSTSGNSAADRIGYQVQVSFVQIVFLRRNPAVTFNRAQTWKAAGQIGVARSAQLSESINQELSKQVDQFIRAYLSVNPK